MKKALLVVAHGSRREASNQEVRALTQLLANSLDGDYIAIKSAFLELADPLIPEGIDDLVEIGAQQIDVLPYFLSAGRHVSQDIPDIIRNSILKYPEIDIHLKTYIGGSSKMIDYICSLLQDDI